MAKKATKKDVNTKDVKTATTYEELKELVLITVGTNDRPASPDDVKEAKEEFLKNKDLSVLITHHAYNITIINNSKDYLVLFRLGSEERPVLEEELKDFEKEYEEAVKERRPIFWNHLIDVSVFPRSAFNKD
jgi:hypothetical protein